MAKQQPQPLTPKHAGSDAQLAIDAALASKGPQPITTLDGGDTYAEISHLAAAFAKDMFDSVNYFGYDVTVDADKIAGNIDEITIESQILGPYLITLTIEDPDWAIQTSGLVTPDTEGDLPFLDINWPRKADGTRGDVWFRLAMVEGLGGDLTSQNLQLVFQHRIISYLQWDWGTLKAKPGTTTYTQFVKQLCDRIPSALTEFTNPILGLGSGLSQQIALIDNFGLSDKVAAPKNQNPKKAKVIDPLSGAATAAKNPTDSDQLKRLTKQPGRSVTVGAGLTAKGSPLSGLQVHCINLVLAVGAGMNAPTIAMEACIFDLMLESDCGVATGWDAENETYGGCLGGNIAVFGKFGGPGSDAVWTAQAQQFFGGGDGYNAGGAISASKSNFNGFDTTTNVAVLGSQVTAPIPYDAQGISTQYEREGSIPGFVAEAKAIVAHFSGGTSNSDPSGSGGTGSSSSSSGTDTTSGQVQRGGPNNPDQDSWSAIQSLGSNINFAAYTSIGFPGNFGNYLYFVSQEELMDQQTDVARIVKSQTLNGTWDLYTGGKTVIDPTTNLITETPVAGNVVLQSPSYTLDSSAFIYKKTRKRKGKLQQKVTSNVKPQTSTTIQFQMQCGVTDFVAGEAFVFEGAGAIDGKWLIEDATRNIVADQFTTFTLTPPTAPTPQTFFLTPAQTASKAKINPVSVNSGSGSVSPGKNGYVNPFAKCMTTLTSERVDMGVDFNAVEGSQILALGDAHVFYSAPSGTGWTSPEDTQAFVGYTLTNGPYAGKHVYVAEDIIPQVSRGDMIKAGQVIATFKSSSTGLETGWASGDASGALAAALGQQDPSGDPGGWASQAGLSFNRLLVSLGCKSGAANAGGDGHGGQPMPPGYP